MADVTLKAVLLGEDRSMSKSMNKAGQAVEGVGKKSSVMGGVLKGVLAAGVIENAASAVVDFGRDSIAAFQGAEKSQRELQDAYSRFPALADVNISKMRELASAIEKKNGADADDIASGQAILGRYKLTGKQLQQMTPLLVDYAVRTGKDIPDAAKALGKALTGSSKLSKELGFKFTDAKNRGKNFQQIMKGLRGTVGGYADKEAKTAAGRTKMLETRMGNLKEMIGAKLTPAVEELVKRGEEMISWLEENPEALDTAAESAGGLGGAALNLASAFGDTYVFAMVMANRATDAFASNLADMLDVIGMIPGFGQAKEWAAKLRGVAVEARRTAQNLGMIGKQKIIVNTSTGIKSVRQLNNEIKRLKGKIVTAKARGDSKEVASLQRRIAAIRSRTVTITANVRIIGRSVRIGAIAGARLGVLRAMGGPITAGSPYWVGEHGPELFLPGSNGHIKNPFQIANKLSGSTASSSSSSVTNNYFTINTPAAAPLAFAKAVETELVKLRQSRGGAGTLRF